ncbi:MAG: hypothetical protein ACYS30_23170 [Planctomycetota bacterium]
MCRQGLCDLRPLAVNQAPRDKFLQQAVRHGLYPLALLSVQILPGAAAVDKALDVPSQSLTEPLVGKRRYLVPKLIVVGKIEIPFGGFPLLAVPVFVCCSVNSHFSPAFYFEHNIATILIKAAIAAVAAHLQDHFAETQALNIISVCNV